MAGITTTAEDQASIDKPVTEADGKTSKKKKQAQPLSQEETIEVFMGLIDRMNEVGIPAKITPLYSNGAKHVIVVLDDCDLVNNKIVISK